MRNWQLNSWSTKPDVQAIKYPNDSDLKACVNYLSKKSQIVDIENIYKLQYLLAESSKGKIFILQGGDCAEQFSNPIDNSINSAKLLHYLSNLIESTTNKPVITIGRIAGQFAKPRTSIYDLNNKKVYNYRGDLINKRNLDEFCRLPDPNLLITGYYKSQNIYNALNKLPTKKINGINFTVPYIFTSHEALNLHYEQALTHLCEKNRYYNFSTHFPWVGVRTNQLNSAHIEYLRGIYNPIGLKIGANMETKHILQVIDSINPNNIPGRITLITRLGHKNVTKYLPKLINYITKNNKKVTWLCDPMHGNTTQDSNGVKCRILNDIKKEISETLKCHFDCNSLLSGLHLELTPENVKECKTQIHEKTDDALMDPRLNKEQSIEVVGFFCQKFRNSNYEL